MIIFGTKGVTTTPERGVFHCPACGAGAAFRLRRVRRFFTLYFIPVIPLDKLGEFIECDHCRGTYDLAVLDFDPAKIALEFEAEYHKAVRKVMIAMVLADGRIEESETTAVCELYQELTGRPMFPGDVKLEASDLQTSGTTIEGLLQQVIPSLNDHGREKVFEAAWRVAAADGEMHPSEQQLLSRIATALGLSAGHYQGLLLVLSEKGRLPEPASPALTAPPAPPPLPRS